MPEGPVIFISCGIFKDELQYLLKEKGVGNKILFLDTALHVNFDKLKARLTETLKEHKKSRYPIRVLYGHCHPEIMEILDQYGARKIRAGNCLEAMVGSEELMRLNSEATSFFLTAGWVNNWEEMFEHVRRDFNFPVSSMFDGYKRIIVFDTGVIPIDREKVKRFSRFSGLPVEWRHISLDHFMKLISDV